MKEIQSANNLKEYRAQVKKRNVVIDLMYFRDLLAGIKENEDIKFSNCEEKVKKWSFKGAVLCLSSNTIYRHISILALKNYYDRNTTYKVHPLSGFLDSWFVNSSESKDKQDLMKVDILILHGLSSTFKEQPSLLRNVLEIIDIRKSYGLNTWIFIVENEKSEITINYINTISNMTNKTYSF